jgi:hypothetical protein
MAEQTSDALKRIGQKIERLRTLDTGFSLFGAVSHHYRLGTALTESALQAMEREFGVTLPTAYRQFLRQIGHGGAGPYYGLFTLNDEDSENITSVESLSQPFTWTEAFNAAGRENSCEDGVDEFVETDEFQQMDLPGALYISNYGCALRFFLIVTGPCKGEVWHDWRGEDSGVYPAVDATGRRLGFLEWYERWLDQSIENMIEEQASV